MSPAPRGRLDPDRAETPMIAQTTSRIAEPRTHLPGQRRVTMGDRAQRDAEFSAYMEARQASLMRTAYLISGDRHTAEDLVQTALAKLYLAWDRVEDRGSLDGYVRRVIVNEHNSLWRRPFKRREHATDTLPEQAAPVTETDRNEDLWSFVQTLPRKQRAAVVLRYYEELSEA